LENRVIFAGAIDDVGPVLGAADAFVLPTLYDPFPNACLEAMATGLPVITSSQCGAAELVVPNRAGMALDALDTDGLTESMRQLLNPDLRVAMGERSRAIVAPFTREVMTSRLVRLYHSLLGANFGLH
jgi:UDP-glucose:(heptosyl)LPS alpha-1,3-glucosyltransferase